MVGFDFDSLVERGAFGAKEGKLVIVPITGLVFADDDVDFEGEITGVVDIGVQRHIFGDFVPATGLGRIVGPGVKVAVFERAGTAAGSDSPDFSVDDERHIFDRQAGHEITIMAESFAAVAYGEDAGDDGQMELIRRGANFARAGDIAGARQQIDPAHAEESRLRHGQMSAAGIRG